MATNKETIKVSIIEDNTEFAKLLKKMLDSETAYTFDVSLNHTLDSGIKQITKNPTDVILLDINLPDSNGIETLNNVYSNAGNTPIIVITGETNENLVSEGVNLGIQDFLIKGEVGKKKLVRSIIIAIERFKVFRNKFISTQFNSDEEYFQKIIKNSADAMLVLDKNGYVLFSNEAAKELFSKNDEELNGKNFSLPSDSELASEIEILDKDNEKLIFEMRTTEIELLGETVFITSFRDITDRKELENKLRDLSNRDDITNLLNRRGFEFLADQHYKLAKRTKSGFVIAFFDLDDLKKINDVHGHLEGTRSIIETSRILSKTFRSSDLLARWGGDEFIVLGINTLEDSKEIIIKRLKKNLDDFNSQSNLQYNISLSVGLAFFNPDNPKTLDELVLEADKKMYLNKNHKKKTPTKQSQLKYNDINKNIIENIG